MDRARIQCALQCLAKHPQNNLRIWNGGQLIVGHGRLPGNDDVEAGAILQEIFPHIHSDYGADTSTPVNRLIVAISQTVAGILIRETLLSRTFAVQRLDITDADGAIILWKHLIDLCNGDAQEAERLISTCQGNNTTQAVEEKRHPGRTMLHVPISEFNNSSALDMLREKLASFREALEPHQETGTLPEEKFLDDAYRESVAIVHALSLEESAQILADWLLSLSVCDMSIFVTLRPVSMPASAHIDRSTDCNENMVTVDKFQPQLDGKLGHFTLFHADLAVRYAYEVKVVDCDAKPASKLKDREENEKVINLYF
jgi:hypothetical protein